MNQFFSTLNHRCATCVVPQTNVSDQQAKHSTPGWQTKCRVRQARALLSRLRVLNSDALALLTCSDPHHPGR
jgi:hypothetical protein